MYEVFWSYLIGLSAYRLWRIYALDKIGNRARMFVIQHDRLDRFGEFLHCPWCVGFWYCVILTTLAGVTFEDWSLLTYALVCLAASALAGFAGMIDLTVNENDAGH